MANRKNNEGAPCKAVIFFEAFGSYGFASLFILEPRLESSAQQFSSSLLNVERTQSAAEERRALLPVTDGWLSRDLSRPGIRIPNLLRRGCSATATTDAATSAITATLTVTTLAVTERGTESLAAEAAFLLAVATVAHAAVPVSVVSKAQSDPKGMSR